MNWYVLYTKSRNEKAVAERLWTIGIEAYCPVLRKRKRWSDRWKWVDEPLLRSYCLVRLEEAEREKVFLVPGVVRYLFYCGKPAKVREEEIWTLQHWLSEYDHESIEAEGFQVHDQVCFKRGPLLHLQGEVVERSGHYLILKLHVLGILIRVDLRKNSLEKIRR